MVAFSSRRPRDAEARIAELAEEQYGVVGLGQLEEIGWGGAAVRKRGQSGRLHRIHAGVFAVGHRSLGRRGEQMAAVLACGDGAVLSHGSAAELWGFGAGSAARIDVTAPNRRGRSPSGITAHRDGTIQGADHLEIDGIPCTTVPRTLLDLAGSSSVGDLRRALSEAEVLRLLDKPAVRRLIRRSRGRRGVARLRVLLDELHPETNRTRSELERLFLRMVTRAKLPSPEVNVWLPLEGGAVKPDFLWRDANLIVETDSRRFHDTDSTFVSDRRREQRLLVAGWRVSRCTWEEVEQEPLRLARTVATLIAQG
jgi:very-short-patch-repair endonuclease